MHRIVDDPMTKDNPAPAVSQPPRRHTTAQLTCQMLKDVYPSAQAEGDTLSLIIPAPFGLRTLQIECQSNGAYVFTVTDPLIWQAYRALDEEGSDPDTDLSEAGVSAQPEGECFIAFCLQQRHITRTVPDLAIVLIRLLTRHHPILVEQQLQLSRCAQSVADDLAVAHHYAHGGNGSNVEPLSQNETERLRELAESVTMAVSRTRDRRAKQFAGRSLEHDLSRAVQLTVQAIDDVGQRYTADAVFVNFLKTFYALNPQGAESYIEAYRASLRNDVIGQWTGRGR